MTVKLRLQGLLLVICLLTSIGAVQAGAGGVFGDAPDPTYPTLLASNGPRHAVGALRLGVNIDSEADGQPTADATGDDLNGFDDEDGVIFMSAIIPGSAANVDVIASGPGLLNAWYDFNLNGSFLDAGEQIFTDQALAAGINSLGFSVPAGAVMGDTFARFRFDSGGGLSPTGLAADGEVEDYFISTTPVDLQSFSVE